VPLGLALHFVGFELVLVLVLVRGVGLVRVLVKMVRFRTDSIEIAPPNQPVSRA